MSEPIKITFRLGVDNVFAKLTEVKVFPSPFTVEVTKTTFPSSFLGRIKFILVTNNRKASAIREESFIPTSSDWPFSTFGNSAKTGVEESLSTSCFVFILIFKSSFM